MDTTKPKLFLAAVSPEMGQDELNPAPDGVDSLNGLFKWLRTNVRGRIQKMYLDTKSQAAVHVGYVVTSKERDDRDGTEYSVETWYELLESYESVEPVTRYRPVGVKHG